MVEEDLTVSGGGRARVLTTGALGARAKGRIPGEILNIVEHLSILSSIGNEDEKVKIDPLVKEGESYCEFSSTIQFLKNHSTISQWATRANSIQIDI